MRLLTVINLVCISACLCLSVPASAGNSERLLEMLHGSDGLGKLVSDLQHKEEEEAKVQGTAALDGQGPVSRKRGREEGPSANGTHTHDRSAPCHANTNNADTNNADTNSADTNNAVTSPTLATM